MESMSTLVWVPGPAMATRRIRWVAMAGHPEQLVGVGLPPGTVEPERVPGLEQALLDQQLFQGQKLTSLLR